MDFFNHNFREEEYGYPKSNINRIFQKILLCLPVFSSKTIKFGSFEDRSAARHKFRGIFPQRFQNVTLIGDSTDFPISKNEELPTSGEGGVWSHKLGDYGTFFL
jgi:hypothetical protein